MAEGSITSPAVEVAGLSHRYGDRVALNGVSFSVPSGGVFGLLGPNGGGKTTLFRILCTSFPPSEGSARILGDEVRLASAVRRRIGVVFQEPSLDRKLTVRENLRHHGHLYGLHGADLRTRIAAMLDRFRLADRAGDRAETLSGGLRRRVELAKALLHRPEVLLMDEPSTGLDPGARRDLWETLRSLDGVTVLMTTHLMEDADRCSRLGILNEGKLVALGTPDELRAEIGGDVVTVASRDPQALATEVGSKFGRTPLVVDGTLRVEIDRGHEFAARLVEAFPGRIDSVTVGKPTLEDVFIRKTGHRFWSES